MTSHTDILLGTIFSSGKRFYVAHFFFSIKEQINVNEQDYLHIATEDLEHLH